MEPESTIIWRQRIQKFFLDIQEIIWLLGLIWSELCTIIIIPTQGIISYCFVICVYSYMILSIFSIFKFFHRYLSLFFILISIFAMLPYAFILNSIPKLPVNVPMFYILGFIFFLFFDLCIFVCTFKSKD
ncbi:MAG: hypothetical protein WC663_00090 [Patescibacteria group bacterium]|jgi:hypothetical protein